MSEGWKKDNKHEPAVLRAMTERRFSKNRFEDSYLSDRPFESYEKIFGLTGKDIEGKNILDLGSGASESFKRGVDKRGLKANIASVNPKLGPDDYRGAKARKSSGKKNALAAVAEELPFKDESFDLILSLAGVPLWLPPREEDYAKAFREMARVLKSGGVIKLYPVNSGVLRFAERALRELRGSGYAAVTESVKLSDEEKEKLQLKAGTECLIIRKPELAMR